MYTNFNIKLTLQLSFRHSEHSPPWRSFEYYTTVSSGSGAKSGQALSTELYVPKGTTMTRMSGTFLSPFSFVVHGKGWGLTQWTDTITELHPNSPEKKFSQIWSGFSRTYFYFCVCTWPCTGECACRASPEARGVLISWSICGRPGLLCRCCNPNSSPYDWTAGTLNQLSHLSRTEILTWCPKYNYNCKFISICLVIFISFFLILKDRKRGSSLIL